MPCEVTLQVTARPRSPQPITRTAKQPRTYVKASPRLRLGVRSCHFQTHCKLRAFDGNFKVLSPTLGKRDKISLKENRDTQ